MQEITLAYSPAINALIGVFYLKMQLLIWLNQSFKCHSFKEVKSDAKVYIFMDSEGKQQCGKLNYGEYLGCHYPDHRIYLHQGLFGKGEHKEYFRPWLLKDTLVHELGHEFLPNNKENVEIQEYEKVHC